MLVKGSLSRNNLCTLRTSNELGGRGLLCCTGLDLLCGAPPTSILLHPADLLTLPPGVLSDLQPPLYGRGCICVGDDVPQELLHHPDTSSAALSFVSEDEVDLWSKSRPWLLS